MGLFLSQVVESLLKASTIRGKRKRARPYDEERQGLHIGLQLFWRRRRRNTAPPSWLARPPLAPRHWTRSSVLSRLFSCGGWLAQPGCSTLYSPQAHKHVYRLHRKSIWQRKRREKNSEERTVHFQLYDSWSSNRSAIQKWLDFAAASVNVCLFVLEQKKERQATFFSSIQMIFEGLPCFFSAAAASQSSNTRTGEQRWENTCSIGGSDMDGKISWRRCE